MDCENYVDTLVGVLNAGVRWLGEPFVPGTYGTTEVTSGFAFSGKRALHAATTRTRERAQIRLSRRAHAPDNFAEVVAEFVYRPVRSRPVTLKDWIVFQPLSADWRAVAGIELRASGTAAAGSYRIDVLEGAGENENRRRRGVISGLKQNRWARFLLLRRSGDGAVQLWAGTPDRETYIGSYTDCCPGESIAHLRLGDDSDTAIMGSGYWDDVRVGPPIKTGTRLRPGEPKPFLQFRQSPPVEPIPVGTARHLFVDKWLIASTQGVRRKLHAIEKSPANPLIVPEHPWEGAAVLGGGAVFRDETTGEFKMWYKAHCPEWGPHPKQERLLKRSFTCLATSPDGMTWTKPQFALHQFKGSRRNNIVIAIRDNDIEHELWEPWDIATGARGANTILCEPDDPDPERRFKALVRVRGFSLLTSPDGIHWTDRGTVFDQAYDSTTGGYDPVRKVHYGCTKLGYENRRARGYTESADGLHWSDTAFQMTVDHRDHPDDQMYGMDAFWYETLHLAFLRMYHVGLGERLDLQLASARDPRKWDRTFRDPIVPCGDRESDEWDWANQSIISVPPVPVGDELWIYYSGRTADHRYRDHLQRKIDMNTPWGRIGMGRLRLDGFVSVDAGARGGVLETRVLDLVHDELWINADAAGGEIRIELTDPAGKPLPGYGAGDCRPVGQDKVRQQVCFKKRRNLPGAGTPLRIRFHISNASLYAVWTQT